MSLNWTMIGQTLTFIVFVWACWKWIWPLLINAMRERQQAIADGLASAERAAKDLELAQERATDQLKEAKDEAAGLIEQARQRANQMIEDAKNEAREEGERLKAEFRCLIESLAEAPDVRTRILERLDDMEASLNEATGNAVEWENVRDAMGRRIRRALEPLLSAH